MKKYLIQIGIILFAAAALYVVYPKYYFSDKGRIRGNRITGQVDRYTHDSWENQDSRLQDKINDLKKENKSLRRMADAMSEQSRQESFAHAREITQLKYRYGKYEEPSSKPKKDYSKLGFISKDESPPSNLNKDAAEGKVLFGGIWLEDDVGIFENWR